MNNKKKRREKRKAKKWQPYVNPTRRTTPPVVGPLSEVLGIPLPSFCTARGLKKQLQQTPPGEKVMVVAMPLESTLTEQELIDMMRQYGRLDMEPLATVTVSGWDDDPRGLHIIPECVAFFKRMMNVGFLAILKRGLPGDPQGRTMSLGLTAYAIWAMGNQKDLHKAETDEYREEFLRDMEEQKRRHEFNIEANDGQNRTMSGVWQ